VLHPLPKFRARPDVSENFSIGNAVGNGTGSERKRRAAVGAGVSAVGVLGDEIALRHVYHPSFSLAVAVLSV
jgi:hypothetical protein